MPQVGPEAAAQRRSSGCVRAARAAGQPRSGPSRPSSISAASYPLSALVSFLTCTSVHWLAGWPLVLLFFCFAYLCVRSSVCPSAARPPVRSLCLFALICLCFILSFPFLPASLLALPNPLSVFERPGIMALAPPQCSITSIPSSSLHRSCKANSSACSCARLGWWWSWKKGRRKPPRSSGAHT